MNKTFAQRVILRDLSQFNVVYYVAKNKKGVK